SAALISDLPILSRRAGDRAQPPGRGRALQGSLSGGATLLLLCRAETAPPERRAGPSLRFGYGPARLTEARALGRPTKCPASRRGNGFSGFSPRCLLVRVDVVVDDHLPAADLATDTRVIHDVDHQVVLAVRELGRVEDVREAHERSV